MVALTDIEAAGRTLDLAKEQGVASEELIVRAFQSGIFLPRSQSIHRQIMAEAARGGDAELGRIAEHAACDPVLGLRLLSLVNSAVYARARAVISVRECVHLLGIQRCADDIARLGAERELSSFFAGRGLLTTEYHAVVLAHEIAQRIFTQFIARSPLRDMLFPAILALHLPELLLLSQRPAVAAAWILRSFRSNGVCADLDYEALFGMSKSFVLTGTVKALGLPDDFAVIVRICDALLWRTAAKGGGETKDTQVVAISCERGLKLARAIMLRNGKVAFDEIWREVRTRCGIALKDAASFFEGLVEGYARSCAALNLEPHPLPQYWSVSDEARILIEESESVAARFGPFLTELKVCLRSRDPAGHTPHMYHAILCTIRALVQAVGFERAFFLRFEPEREFLLPEYFEGEACDEFRSYLRAVHNPDSKKFADAIAFLERRAVFQGESCFRGFPLVAFPAVVGQQVIGVFYADCLLSRLRRRVSTQAQVACVALAETWQTIDEGFE